MQIYNLRAYFIQSKGEKVGRDVHYLQTCKKIRKVESSPAFYPQIALLSRKAVSESEKVNTTLLKQFFYALNFPHKLSSKIGFADIKRLFFFFYLR